MGEEESSTEKRCGNKIKITLFNTFLKLTLAFQGGGITELINYGIRKRHPACGHYSLLAVFCAYPRTRLRKSKIKPINMMIIINGSNFLGHPNRTRSRWRRNPWTWSLITTYETPSVVLHHVHRPGN